MRNDKLEDGTREITWRRSPIRCCELIVGQSVAKSTPENDSLVRSLIYTIYMFGSFDIRVFIDNLANDHCDF